MRSVAPALHGGALLRRLPYHALSVTSARTPHSLSRRALTVSAAIPGTDVVGSSGLLEAGYTYLDVR